jgi:glycosyltransferase involved in cell wall biosynthesis
MSKFSVLIPVYKKENPQKFSDALASIFENTLKPDDVLLVCDGPLTPELEKVIDSYLSHSNFRILRIKENKGIVNALNAGLGEVYHDIVVRCDSDDINHPERFSKLVNKMNEGYDVVGSQTNEIDSSGRIIAKKMLPQFHTEILRYARNRNPINHMTVAFRASHVFKVGGYPDIYLKEDYALWAKLINSGCRFFNLSDPLVFANAGIDMYARRGGVKAAVSELQLQSILVRCGISTLTHALIIGIARAIILLSPISFRASIYRNFLRKT